MSLLPENAHGTLTLRGTPDPPPVVQATASATENSSPVEAFTILNPNRNEYYFLLNKHTILSSSHLESFVSQSLR